MGAISRNWAKWGWGLIPLSVFALIIGSLLHGGRFVHADQTPPPTVKEIKVGTARPGTLYAFTLAVKDPAQVQGSDAVLATVKDAQGVIDSKWLHTADLDFYLTLRPRAAGPVTVSLSSTQPAPEISTSLRKILETPALPTEGGLTPGVIAAAPNGTWQTAQPFAFGQTIYGSDDERPYAPSAAKTATPPWSKASNGSSSLLRKKSRGWSTSPSTLLIAMCRWTWTSSKSAKTT